MVKKGKAKGWYGDRQQHSMAKKGVKTSKLMWTDIKTLRKEYSEYSSDKLLKMALNLEKVIERRHVHPVGAMAKEEKEEYIDNMNRLQAMTLVLDERGIAF